MIHSFDGLSRWNQFRGLRRLIRRVRPDIVHTAIFDADVVGRIAGWRTGAKVVSSLVNTSYAPRARLIQHLSTKLRFAQSLDGWTARHLTDRIHAVSEGVAWPILAT